ncbi:MAG: Asp23/Gls24 family envelope stress response protein [Oscillospiraceae bacterium]|nr:Asp23/Gls24 family envelope stress response protein [Clostridiales bacterium]MDY2690974.1 Asp23/Gls24 family envelope stress response protein [Oscillospiraceae bacterium]
MAENKEYFTQEMENGSIQISEDVVASVTGMAVLEVEGVCGLSSSIGTDIAEMLGMKTLSKGVRLSTTETGALRVDCDVVSKFGQNIFELAKNVQENVKSSVESVTGLRVAEVNVTVCGIALPKDSKK